MAYEYGSSSQSFSLANPLRIHNYFLASAAAIAGLTGFYLLLSARSTLQGTEHASAIGVLIVSFVVLVVTGRLIYRVLSQLRFYFGRGRPAALAPMLSPDELGTTPRADNYIKEALRQQALEYIEPANPLSGVLYSIIPNLIYAPPPIRSFAERQFRAGAFTLSIIAGLLIALVFSAGSSNPSAVNVSRWAALAYLAIAAPSLWRSAAERSPSSEAANSISIPMVVGLLVFSVVGPTAISIISSKIPAPPLDISPTMVIVLLTLALLLHILFFVAIARHALPPPMTSVSVKQDTWNLSW
ncbi:hypothetical protein [uncultured Sphingomonas sp.]|uniref:hypothetical protein n=1 Tax=uncultured Sphingomonas sp. TaxID=158754 RepID=UPI0035CAF660